MAITSPRSQHTLLVGVAWQDAEGTAADASDARRIAARRVRTLPGRTYIDLQGTFGSSFMKRTHREVAREPSMELELWGAIEALPIFLESAMMGTPTVADADISETGDSAGVLSSWSLVGVRPGFNTEYTGSGAKLYVTVTDETPGAGQAQVSVYKDSARSKLVAQGSAADGSVVALSEQNGSGLSGSVTLGTVLATNAGIVLTVDRVTLSFSDQPQRFLTVWHDTGSEHQKLSDCVVRKISLSSADKEALVASIELVAKDNVPSGTFALSGAPSSLSVYSHQDVSMRSAVDTTPVIESVASIEWGIQNELFTPLASSDRPVRIIKKFTELSLRTSHVHSNEAQALIDAGDVGVFQTIDVTYSLGGKSLMVTWRKAKPIDPRLPDFEERQIGSVELDWAIREEVSSSPETVMSLTYEP